MWARAHIEGVAVTALEGNRAVLPVGLQGPPCLPQQDRTSRQLSCLLLARGEPLTLQTCVVICRLNHFRWIVPANGEVTLQVHFSSDEFGNFDQTFNFEILGTCCQYQLYCRGICTYPYICQDPK